MRQRALVLPSACNRRLVIHHGGIVQNCKGTSLMAAMMIDRWIPLTIETPLDLGLEDTPHDHHHLDTVLIQINQTDHRPATSLIATLTISSPPRQSTGPFRLPDY